MIRIGWRGMVFLGICLLQLAVPAGWLVMHEAALSRGEVFRFQCAPVDPVDALRGRYVQLGFEEQFAPIAPDTDVAVGDDLFVRIETGPDGLARLGEGSATAPDGAYVKARVIRLRNGGDAAVSLPFDRYYMDERKAPETEQAYRDGVASGASGTFVTVRVLGGTTVIEALHVDGVPVGS
jgi:uncharacterized membrane-anchored protein